MGAGDEGRPLPIQLGIWAQGGSTVQDVQQNVRMYSSQPEATGIQVPPLPSHFVDRDEIVRPLIAQLTDPGSQRQFPIFVIHGMGGSGKSTLAAALATAPRVTARFPDGVLWPN